MILPSILVSSTRCDVDEVLHTGHVAVAHLDTGRIVALGTESTLVPMRSTAKPFQLAALLDTIETIVTPTERELAAMSSSHNGEHRQTRTIVHLLAKGGLTARILECGSHEPFRKSVRPSALTNNCSGKHAAMALAALAMTGHPEGYSQRDHPVQVIIADSLAAFIGEVGNAGTDGCGVPTYAYSLGRIAQAFARFAVASRASSLGRIAAAHRHHGYYVGGTDRLESHLLRKYCVNAKSGSDGVWAAGVASRRMGIAVKVIDGNEAAAQRVVLELLRLTGVLDPQSDPYLAKYVNSEILSQTGRTAGSTTVSLDLKTLL